MLIIIRYDDHVFIIYYIDASGSRDGAVVRALASHSDSGWVSGWVCFWFSSLLREVFLRVLRFSPLIKNQHFQIPIRSGSQSPRLAVHLCTVRRWSYNKVIYRIYIVYILFYFQGHKYWEIGTASRSCKEDEGLWHNANRKDERTSWRGARPTTGIACYETPGGEPNGCSHRQNKSRRN